MSVRLIADWLSSYRMVGCGWGYPRLMANCLKNITDWAQRERPIYSDSHGLPDIPDGSALEYDENGAFSVPMQMINAV